MIDKPVPDSPELTPSEIFTEREARLFALPAKIRKTFRECCYEHDPAEASAEANVYALGVLIGAIEMVSAEALEIYEEAKGQAIAKAPKIEALKPVAATSDDALIIEMDKTIADLKHQIQTLEIERNAAINDSRMYKNALADAHAQIRRMNTAPVKTTISQVPF